MPNLNFAEALLCYLKGVSAENEHEVSAYKTKSLKF